MLAHLGIINKIKIKINTKKNIEINRKVLADIAIHDPETFAAIVKEAHA